jgi:hypothetical protein
MKYKVDSNPALEKVPNPRTIQSVKIKDYKL